MITMTKPEIVTLLLHKCRTTFAQVATPQYYDGEGPFIVALDEEDGRPVFFFFTIADSEEFLLSPQSMPLAFDKEDFFYTAADQLDIRHLEHIGQYCRLFRHKVIPHEPACQAAAQKLWLTDADTAKSLLLVGTDGVWHTAKTIHGNTIFPA